ncbi:hypothetical protein FGO68_gene12735 [Halteria grandinella]|uniref:GAR domain-containing protein n=1 Tax=Halteria grandinella TaxID=5974 RepID=A0A8J8P2S2_HALGN|nr:hypothetical protein FGO68_gene12735 [Halteria grandinella]
MYYYIGDRAQGQSQIEQEVKKGLSYSQIGEDVSMGGSTPGPFGQIADLSNGGTPLRDKDSNNTSGKFTGHQRGQSTDKKGAGSGAITQGFIEQPSSMTTKNAERRKTTVVPHLKGSLTAKNGNEPSLPDFGGGRPRPSIATNPTEEGQFTSRIPREIRHDPDIEARLLDLDQATKNYLAFDMNRFQSTMNRELEQHILKLNQEYKQHQGTVNAKLEKCEASNEESLVLKDQMVQYRILKQQSLAEVSEQSDVYQAKFSQVNDTKHQLRLQLSDIEKHLREIQREIAATNLENNALKSLLQGEQELEEERANEQQQAYALVANDIIYQAGMIEEDAQRVSRQREFAEASCQQLESLGSETQGRYQKLLVWIQESKNKAQEQLRAAEGELQGVKQENRQLKVQKERNEASQRQLEREVEQLQKQERGQREDWTKRVNELERSINEKRDMIHELIGGLSSVNQEISQLRVQTQTAQYKVEYQQALREMHDNNQYDYKLRKLTADVEASQRKANQLEAELKRIQEEWELQFEEAIIQMRQRLEELGSGACFEAIERLLVQISEKDRVIQGLSQAIHDMRIEVSKVTQNGANQESLQQAQQECTQKMSLYRQLLAEKAILYDQLHASAKQLVHRDDIILKNEQEIIRMKYENDIAKLEIYQKRELLIELEGDLEREKGRYKSLKLELRRLEKHSLQLQQTLKDKEDELDQLEEMLQDRDNMIDELERQISDRVEVQSTHSAAVASVRSLKPQKKLNWYKPIKGDLIDELIAKYFNALSRPMPVKRLGDGFYIFGTRKIYVKLLVGRLVVRVGGGFMSIDEFMEQYASMEMEKVLQMISHGNFSIDEFIEQQFGETIGGGSGKKKAVSRSPKLASPKH